MTPQWAQIERAISRTVVHREVSNGPQQTRPRVCGSYAGTGTADFRFAFCWTDS